MKSFQDFITSDAIIRLLCSYRVRLAEIRHEKYILKGIMPDYPVEQDNYNELSQLLPPRRKWVTLKKDLRYKVNRFSREQALSSIDANMRRLLITIDNAYKTGCKDSWFINLLTFIKDIQDSCQSLTYTVSCPITRPIVKGDIGPDGKIECRPISIFKSYKDRVILSLANKYLTILFDNFFDEDSLAFRAKRNYHTHRNYFTTHHDAIDRILEFRERNAHKNIYVAECDMQKFYDSVRHSIVKKEFARLIHRVHKFYSIDTTAIEHIFYSYLNCYTFPKRVFQLNDDKEYWAYHHINGKFGWVKDELLENGLCTERGISRLKIGVPQGGALSGLIANIVLNCADRNVRKHKGGFLYQRYCDDMILLHTNKKECSRILNSYNTSLKQLMLIPHDIKDVEFNSEQYWKDKSKNVYPWGKTGNEWIGFVGYEIKRSGEVRIRKKSLLKEKNKIKTVVREICKQVTGKKRVTNNSICNTILHKLISMSVGKVALWNYQHIENELCWITGFNRLSDNPYAIKQIKDLDRVRVNALRSAKKYLSRHTAKGNPQKRNTDVTRLGFHGRPFSYFCHYKRMAHQ